jgi:hypothetical protein
LLELLGQISSIKVEFVVEPTVIHIVDVRTGEGDGSSRQARRVLRGWQEGRAVKVFVASNSDAFTCGYSNDGASCGRSPFWAQRV